MLFLYNKLNEVLNLPCMRNGKLVGFNTHSNKTNAIRAIRRYYMQYLYARKTKA